MKNMPVPLTREQLVETLREMADLVEAGDSLEGSLSYELPGPWPGECQDCGGSGVVVHQDGSLGKDPCLGCDGVGWVEVEHPPPGTYALVKAAYMRQGGMRMVGDLRDA